MLFCTSRSDRKILDRVLKSKETLAVTVQWNFLLGLRSPPAPIDDPFERGELVQVQDVDALVSCGVNEVPNGSPNCTCLCCGITLSVFRGPLVQTFQCFVRAAAFSHALPMVWRLLLIFLHNLRNSSLVIFENAHLSAQLSNFSLMICENDAS